MKRAGSTMCTVHYRIKIAMHLSHNYKMRRRNDYEQYMENTDTVIICVINRTQTSTHLTYLTPHTSRDPDIQEQEAHKRKHSTAVSNPAALQFFILKI